MGSLGTGIRNDIHSSSTKLQLRAKSGKNMDESCKGNQCSSDAAAAISSLKSATCHNKQGTSMETSNVLSACTSQDSFSDNGESRAASNTKTFGGLKKVYGLFTDQTIKEDVGDTEKDIFRDRKILSNHSKNQKGVHFIGDNATNPSEISSLYDTKADDNLPEGEHSGVYQHDGNDCSESVKPDILMGDGKGAVEGVNSLKQGEHGVQFGMSKNVPNLEEPPLQSQRSNESDVSEHLEVEVKVCDICGDTGRENLLAVCSKCTDGAEHSYCMRMKLETIPEGDWMCEECTQKENCEERKRDDFKKKAGTSHGSSLSERRNSFRNKSISASIQTKSLKLDIKPANEEKSGRNKTTMKPYFSNKRPVSNSETDSAIKRRVVEVNSPSSSLKPCSPCRKVVINSASILCRPCRPCRKVVVNSASSSHRACSPCKKAALPRHSSFENLEKGRTKPENHVSSLKDQSSKDIHENECGHGVSRYCSPRSQRRLLPMQGSHTKSISLSSVEQADHDVPQKQKFRKSISFNAKSDNSTSNVVEVRVPSSKNSRGGDLKTTNVKDHRSYQIRMQSSSVVAPGVSSPKTSAKTLSFGKTTKSYPSAGSSCVERPLSSSSNVVDDPSVTKIPDPSNESKPDDLIGSDNAESSSEAALTKRDESVKMHRSLIKSYSSLSSSELDSAVIPNKQFLTDRSLVSADGTDESQERVVGDAYKKPNSHIISDGRPHIVGLPNTAASESKSCQTFVFPHTDFIWKGGFEIQGSERVPKFCYGVQAHLSSFASPKVLELVKKFPCSVLLEEASRISVWPIQFPEKLATEDNIGIYFFAENFYSYTEYYKHLCDCMMKNDVALRGYVSGIELLIFSSNVLPEGSQRWNRLSYLWAVFRERKVYSQKKIFLPDLNELPPDDDDMEHLSDFPNDNTVQTNLVTDGRHSRADRTCNKEDSMFLEQKECKKSKISSIGSYRNNSLGKIFKREDHIGC